MRRWLVLVLLAAAVGVAGCGPGRHRTRPLPRPAQWYGSRIWVPRGYARDIAAVVCRYGDEGQYDTLPYPAGGELVACEAGVDEQYEGG